MSVVKKTLEENYVFFLRELARINAEIKPLPAGSISAKKIGKSTYYYHQWREGEKVKSVSLGADAPADLVENIGKRKLLENQRKEVLENIRVISKAVNTQNVTVDEIIKVLSRNGVKVVLIGSYCMEAYREGLRLSLPTIRTQDVDFLVNSPYKGREADIRSLLAPLGFSPDFNTDGSTYFSNGVFKVEFLTPERGRGTDKAVLINPLKIRAIPLRFLQMLLEHPVRIKKDDYAYFVPAPWVFAFHKILVAGRRKVRAKKEKDLLQANAVLRNVFKNPETERETLSYLEALPSKWKKTIKAYLEKHFHESTTT